MTSEDTLKFAESLINKYQQNELLKEKNLDFAFSF